jgi:phosphoglucosamine mutase
MGETGLPIAELAQVLRKYPQVLVNVKIRQRHDPCSFPEVQAAVEWVRQRLGDDVRVIVRLSGTELLVRVMVEGPEDTMIMPLAEHIAQSINSVLGTL